MFVTLTVPEGGLRPRPDGTFRFNIHPKSIMLITHDGEGRPLAIHRTYVDRLRDEGWLGVDLIPSECIVD